MEPYESRLVILTTNYPIDVLQLQSALTPEMQDMGWQFHDHLRQGSFRQRDLFPSVVMHPQRIRIYPDIGISTPIAIGMLSVDELRDVEKDIANLLQYGDSNAVTALYAFLNNRHDFGGQITKSLPKDTLIPVILDFGEGTYQQTLDGFVAQFGCKKRVLLDKARYRY